MKTEWEYLLSLVLLTGCTYPYGDRMPGNVDGESGYLRQIKINNGEKYDAATLESYKRDVAQRISQVNAAKVYPGRPQALLRSIIVLKYSINAHGNLVRSEILRSNRDRTTEMAALASLRSAVPFPKPALHLLRQGRVDIIESWLFNSDGRFQIRSIAEPQLSE